MCILVWHVLDSISTKELKHEPGALLCPHRLYGSKRVTLEETHKTDNKMLPLLLKLRNTHALTPAARSLIKLMINFFQSRGNELRASWKYI